MRIYVASSWRNAIQPYVVARLRREGHEVYDFRAPAPGVSGFAWSDIDPDWKEWTPSQLRDALQHPIAKAGYAHDINALRRCDVCVLVLPSGRSASWEFGYAMGQGKPGVVFQADALEPELMYREARFATTLEEVVACVDEVTRAAFERQASALARAVEAWREVPEGLRSAAVHVLDTEPSKDSLTEEEMRTWKAAAALLRAAGGGK